MKNVQQPTGRDVRRDVGAYYDVKFLPHQKIPTAIKDSRSSYWKESGALAGGRGAALVQTHLEEQQRLFCIW